MVFLSFLGSVVSCSYGMLHVGTLALPHLHVQCFFRCPGKVAEQCKQLKYGQLSKYFHFVPLGAIGSETLGFYFILKELGHRLITVTGDLQSYEFLIQSLSVAIQRGNAAAVLGSLAQCLA